MSKLQELRDAARAASNIADLNAVLQNEFTEEKVMKVLLQNQHCDAEFFKKVIQDPRIGPDVLLKVVIELRYSPEAHPFDHEDKIALLTQVASHPKTNTAILTAIAKDWRDEAVLLAVLNNPRSSEPYAGVFYYVELSLRRGENKAVQEALEVARGRAPIPPPDEHPRP